MKTLEQLLNSLYPEDSRMVLDSLVPLFEEDKPLIEPLAPGWYKDLVFYVTMPDAFQTGSKPGTLWSLSEHLDRIKGLGCNAMHILPFLESPMVDGGFDVSNFFETRSELGGDEAVEELLREAKSRNISLFMDIALNHVSDQHGWVASAQSGDERYRDYLICSREEPELVEMISDGGGVNAIYKVFGSEVKVPVIFPDHVGKLPHWVKGDNEAWYFHTFYPHQLDVNWHNPQIFVEFSKVLIYWARKGFDFRLDAVPHLDKTFTGEVVKSTSRNHQIIEALRQVVRITHPQRVFLVEVVDSVEQTKTYFGTHHGDKGELAYNFYVLNGIWAGLIEGDSKHIWQSLEQTRSIPRSGQWVTFLRSHDALMPGFIKDFDPTILYEALLPNGQRFGKGLEVAGRTASLVDEDERKLILLYFLLASLPGNPSIYYGDELFKLNDLAYSKRQMKKRRVTTGQKKLPLDARDIGRGFVDSNLLESDKAKHCSELIGKIYGLRNKLGCFSDQMPNRIEHESDKAFMAEYKRFNQRVEVYANLSDEEIEFDIEVGTGILVECNGLMVRDNKLVLPAFAGCWVLRHD